jgi:CheY-like chemotaxis protein
MRPHALNPISQNAGGPRPTQQEALDILLIDDDERELALAVRLLNRSGLDYCLHVAKDGREALHLLFGAQGGAAVTMRPALIVLRLDLADVDGLWVLGAIKGAPDLTDVPMIVLARRSEAGQPRQCMELGTNMYLLKPTSMRDVLRIVMSVERHWIAVDELRDRAA